MVCCTTNPNPFRGNDAKNVFPAANAAFVREKKRSSPEFFQSQLSFPRSALRVFRYPSHPSWPLQASFLASAARDPCLLGIGAGMMLQEESHLSKKQAAELECWQQVKSSEEKRKLRSHTVFLRNRAYWKELVAYQREGYEDAVYLLQWMQAKQAALVSYGKSLMQPAESSPTFPADHSKTRKSAGHLAKKALSLLDESSSKLTLETAAAIEKDILASFSDRLQSYQQEVDRLSEHAKLLFVAWILLDGRVIDCYQQLQQAILSAQSGRSTTSSPDNTRPALPDKWILYTKYTVSTQKFDLLAKHCFVKFKLLFKLAMEIESQRVAIITRSAELFAKKTLELAQQGVTLQSNAIHSISMITNQLSLQEKPLSEELTARVQENSPERANFSLFADYLLHQERCEAGTNTTAGEETDLQAFQSAGLDVIDDFPLAPHPEKAAAPTATAAADEKSSSRPTNAWHPLTCCWTRASFLCFLEQPSRLYGSLWSPVLVVVSQEGYLHIYDLSSSHSLSGKMATGVIGAYQSYVQHHSRQCYEDDLLRPVDPTLRPSMEGMRGRVSSGASLSTAGTNSAGGTSRATSQVASSRGAEKASPGVDQERPIAENALFDQLIKSVDWKDVESNHREVLDQVIARYLSQETPFLEPMRSMSMRQCLYAFTPSATSTENVVTITETQPYNGLLSGLTFGAWTSSVEIQVSLKTRNQQDAMEIISLLRSASEV